MGLISAAQMAWIADRDIAVAGIGVGDAVKQKQTAQNGGGLGPIAVPIGLRRACAQAERRYGQRHG